MDFLTRRIRNAIRGLKQRWAPPAVKRDMWDAEFSSGKWTHLDSTPSAFVYPFVEQYASGGDILDLGCGSGNTANEIRAESYRSYTGVDISAVALQMASRRSAQCARDAKNKYVEADVESYVPAHQFDVILFRESIYYVPLARIKPMLDRYRAHLRPERGVVIVNISKLSSKLYEDVLSILRVNYEVVNDCSDPSGTHVIVLR